MKACYYDRPALAAAKRFWESEEWKALRHYFPVEYGKALDVGSGMGIAAYALTRDGWRTTALEPDRSKLVGSGAIKILSRKAQMDIDIVEEWGEVLPFENASFDLVHARQVLHHAASLEAFCSEIARVLKPGGVLVATREHVLSSLSQLPEFLDSHPLHHLYGGENAYILKDYIFALKKAGFSIQNCLGPLESVINYAPFNEDSLCQEIEDRAKYLPGGKMLASLMLLPPWRKHALKILSALDNRPGRLYTFICHLESDIT